MTGTTYQILTEPVAAAALLLLLGLQTFAQIHGVGGGKIQEGLGRTWKGPSASVFSGILKRRSAAPQPTPRASAGRRTRKSAPPVPGTPVPSEAITFRPGADTGIGEMLASAFSSNPGERAALAELFRQLKQSYENEVAKEGKSNDLAAAMTFFIASNVVAYHNSDLPSDTETDEFYNSIRGVMIATPAITRLSNLEKQQVHDWLVYMGGFVLAGHANAKNTNDASSLADYRSIADQSMRLILGVGPDEFTPDLKPASSSRMIRRPDRYTLTRTSTSSPTLITPPGFSAIKFCPNSTFPLTVRNEASVFSGSLPSFTPVS